MLYKKMKQIPLTIDSNGWYIIVPPFEAVGVKIIKLVLDSSENS